MVKRFVCIWFCYLKTDWISLRKPVLRNSPFVLSTADHGRMLITAVNRLAQRQGIDCGMVLADARAVVPSLQCMEDKPTPSGKLIHAIARWCIRYTPVVAVDAPDGLVLDATGCAHLWGGEQNYITAITKRFNELGYTVRIAMADSIGAAWAVCHYGQGERIIEPGRQDVALLNLSPAALRLDTVIVERLYKLGLKQIKSFIGMPRSALRRRFGESILLRIDQALGKIEETVVPVIVPEPWEERLPCLEPIVTATGIAIALERLLDNLCQCLQKEAKGLRAANFMGYRIDGKMEQISIATTRASHNVPHLFKLFKQKIETIEPALGIELFILNAPVVEEYTARQVHIWEGNCGLDDIKFAELMDRISGKIGAPAIQRYLPAEHYWPERSIQEAVSLGQELTTNWNNHRPRPLQLLAVPEAIQVMAPIPDYPPMHFRHNGKLHKVKNADGPERIEQEWWLQEGEHRDYYAVEDEEGCRYWIFRSGHYTGDKSNQWFLHGYFA
ncbi:MAG: DNA polymerase Y family protein [Chitinophagaceae bacterium]